MVLFFVGVVWVVFCFVVVDGLVACFHQLLGVCFVGCVLFFVGFLGFVLVVQKEKSRYVGFVGLVVCFFD